jgi:hypothetical protein
MFRIEGKIERPHIFGFTAEYRGQDIVGTECAVVRVGGWDVQRYGVRYGYFNYDFIGDQKYMKSRLNVNTPNPNYIHWINPDFDLSIETPFDNIENYTCSYTGAGAHGFWIDYKTAENTSWFHDNTVEGHFEWCNTPLKIEMRDKHQNINTNRYKLKVRGAKTYFFIGKEGRSYVDITGQNNYTRFTQYPEVKGETTWEEKMIPYFYAKTGSCNLNYFIYDQKRNADQRKSAGRPAEKGLIRGDGVDFSGWATLTQANNLSANLDCTEQYNSRQTDFYDKRYLK